MRWHVEDFDNGPICPKCGKPMKTAFRSTGIGMRKVLRCPRCKGKCTRAG
ncbi:MAG: hypothetical protein DRI39_05075 [Chloroflexi bacterium]|nr:MAG: hypothetical protein DRI39_05075 [Chloroflexota bacterium]